MSFPRYPEYKDSGVEWLGDVPAHWSVGSVRNGIAVLTDFTANGSFASLADNVEYQSEGFARLIRMTDLRNGLAEGGIWIDESAYGYLSKSALFGGELLLASVGSVGLVYKMPVVSYAASLAPNMYLLKTNERLLSDFLYWFLISKSGQDQILLVATTTAQPKLNKDNVRSLRLAFPPLAEQEEIGRFLCAETERIDGLLSEQERLITLLKEKRQAVISHAVTKGLDPNAPMKDSGIEWLGEVPAHWHVLALRRLVQDSRRITYGIVQPGEMDPNGRFMVRGQDYSFGWVAPEDIFRVSDAIETPYKRARLVADDLVITIVGAGVGNTAVVPAWLDGANITQTTARLAIDSGIADAGFVVKVLESYVGKRSIDTYAKGAAQPGLNLEHVKIFPITCPPLDEQIGISRHLDEQFEKYDCLIGEAEMAVALLKERRSVLISSAVTGKIDVRAAR